MATGQFPNEGRFTRRQSPANGALRYKRRLRPLYPSALGAEQYGSQAQTANKLATDYFWGVTVSGVTGTVAVTNANDTVVATGTPVAKGTVAVTNANDTVVATGKTVIVGTLARTNANDTVVASGSPIAKGTSSTTNALDTVVAAGSPIARGTLAATNADDTVVASGTAGGLTPITGTVATTNADDTATAAGTPVVTGTSSTTNANDVGTATGISGYVVPDEGGTHTGGYPKAKFFPPRNKPRDPFLMPLQPVTGWAAVLNPDDFSTAAGVVDPFNLLQEDNELLLLV